MAPPCPGRTAPLLPPGCGKVTLCAAPGARNGPGDGALQLTLDWRAGSLKQLSLCTGNPLLQEARARLLLFLRVQGPGPWCGSLSILSGLCLE